MRRPTPPLRTPTLQSMLFVKQAIARLRIVLSGFADRRDDGEASLRFDGQIRLGRRILPALLTSLGLASMTGQASGQVSITAGTGPFAVAINPVTNKIYVANFNSITHTADLNGDGKADILWKHTDGTVNAWLMNGLSVSGTSLVLGANTGYSITHTPDLNGDGKADLLWKGTDGTV